MRRTMLVAMVLAAPQALAQSQSDIVWPTYDQVALVSDSLLNCTALQAEAARVASDIHVLLKAQTRVEDVLRSSFDMERYGGGNAPGGMRVGSTTVIGREAYAEARGQIVSSLKIARQRRDHLKDLEPDCKPAPQTAAAP